MVAIALLAVAIKTVAVAEVWHGVESNNTKAILHGGLAVGAALSAKYIAAEVVAVPLTRAIMLFFWRSQNRAVFFAALLTAVSLLVVSPWLIKNLWWTGNPVCPLLHQIFLTPYRHDTARQVFDDEHISPFTHLGDNPDLL